MKRLLFILVLLVCGNSNAAPTTGSYSTEDACLLLGHMYAKITMVRDLGMSPQDALSLWISTDKEGHVSPDIAAPMALKKQIINSVYFDPKYKDIHFVAGETAMVFANICVEWEKPQFQPLK